MDLILDRIDVRNTLHMGPEGVSNRKKYQLLGVYLAFKSGLIFLFLAPAAYKCRITVYRRNSPVSPPEAQQKLQGNSCRISR